MTLDVLFATVKFLTLFTTPDIETDAILRVYFTSDGVFQVVLVTGRPIKVTTTGRAFVFWF